jgi:hypothetical protein
MNIFQSYCEIWKLEVNVNKTKVVVLSKGKIRLKYEFKLQNKTLEIVDSYSTITTMADWRPTRLRSVEN